jgi:PKD repeat protein
MSSLIKKTVVASLLILSFSIIAPGSAFACHVNDPAFSTSFRGLNEDLNDYARILADADSNDRACAEAADYALTAKVSAIPLSTWGSWLYAGNAAIVFAAANRIGANGFATKDLDNALKAMESYVAVGHEPPVNGQPACSKESVNQCVDDYAVAAPGFAWLAAYKYRRGDPDGDVASLQQQAIGAINAAFSEVCIRKSDDVSLCNGSIAELDALQAYTLSLNHGQQMPSYGFGLMTSLASAALGLQASNYSFSFTADQQKIARGLAREMQAHVTNNAFNNDCVSISRDGNNVFHLTSATLPCGGPDGYVPGMYELKEFYDGYFGGMPAASYQADLNSFNSGIYNLGPSDGGFFSWGRYTYYFGQSYDWVHTPREYLPFDTVNPIGYIDQIDANGLATGWTCDQDAPAHSNRVDLYSNGVFAAFAYATLPSEQAVNSWCGGGTAHRFQAQLPSSARGTSIVAYGLDYTWYGFTQLTCASGNCSTWTDNPPTASFTIPCTGRSCTANAGASSDDVGITGYQWNWGDGQTGSGGPTAGHAFAVNGTYTVTLTVTDTIGQTGSTTRTVTVTDNPPVASFTIACTGRACTTNAAASSDDVGIASYQWNWGDSQTGSGGPGSSHSFAVNGTYTVTLTVTDTIGQTGSTTRTVTVTDNPPVASFTISCTSLTCTTNASASSDDIGVASYQWNWGDSQTSNGGPSGSHTFAAAGTYTVTLTVGDTIGQTGSTTRTVTVAPCVAPAISTQPTASPSSIPTGSSSTLTIAVTGTAPVTVQWYTLAGTFVGSGTSISVSPTATTTYYAIVSNACGSVQSSNCTVTICSPGLGTAPTATPSTITAGQTSRLDMGSATGTPTLTYLWYKSDGTFVASTTAKKLNVSPTVTTSYYYKVSNSCGTTGPSPTVTVTVQ